MCIEYICVERYAAVVRNAMPNFYRDWHQLNEMLKKKTANARLDYSVFGRVCGWEVCEERGFVSVIMWQMNLSDIIS